MNTYNTTKIKDEYYHIPIDQRLNPEAVEMRKILGKAPVIRYTPEAFAKQCALIMCEDTEIAWHGLVDTSEEGVYLITDILVYPQTVSASTVGYIAAAYEEWFDECLNKGIVSSIRADMHSHVNMGVHPSGTDLRAREEIVEQLNDSNPFYIFMIWNKFMCCSSSIYDVKNDIEWQNVDIEVKGIGSIHQWECDETSTKIYRRCYNTTQLLSEDEDEEEEDEDLWI